MGKVYDAMWNLGGEAWPHVAPFVTPVWTFLNTNFSTALFGALGGSLSAYWLGVRNDRRNKLREEIAATNNAIGMTMNILNMMLSLKGQYVPITERYEQQFLEYFTIAIAPNPPPGPHELVLKTNFQIFPMPHTMIDEVQRTIIERVTRSPLAQMLIGSLQRALAALARTLEQRARLIDHVRQAPQPVQILLYFGLRDATGNQDDTYPDTLTAMKVHVDESIYYCELLMEILVKHGERLRKAHGRRAAQIVKVDLNDPRVSRLMPSRADFADFERQFRAPEEVGRIVRVWSWIVARPRVLWVWASRSFASTE